MKSNIILSLLCLFSVALGQDESVTMKVDVVAWGDAIEGISFKPNDASKAVTAQPFRYSTPLSYKGSRLMEIHQLSSSAKKVYEVSAEDKIHESNPLKPSDMKDGEKPADNPLLKQLQELRKEKPTLVALVSLPVASRCTVLLAPMAEGFFQGYVIEDDPTKLPLGQVRIMNLSPHMITMRCNGTASKELKTRESVTVPPQGGGIVYELAYQKGKEWILQENNMLAVKPDEQLQLIVLRSDNQFFLSSDGSRTGYLQTVVLKRRKEVEPVATP
jgi:hypothetical protein